MLLGGCTCVAKDPDRGSRILAIARYFLDRNPSYRTTLLTLAARNIEAHHPAPDRLLRIVLRAQDRGVLQRMVKQEITIVTRELRGEGATPLKAQGQTGETSQGGIGVDLPFLIQDVWGAWQKLMAPSASFAQCSNLRVAIARLVGPGVCGHSFSQYGLEIMKQALETRATPPTSPSSSSGLKTSGKRLELVEIWLYYPGEELL